MQDARVHQVIAGHAEARGSDLLDAAVPERIVDTVVGFATLTGVRPRPNGVHRDGKRLMRLLRDGAVAHCACGEAFDDFACGFDLGDVNRFAGLLELHESAQGHETVRSVVDMRGVLLEQVVITTLGGLLKQENRLGVVEVVLTGATPLVIAAGAQIAVGTARPLVRVRHTVPDCHFFGDFVKSRSPDTRSGAGEVFVDDFLVQADGFEQLRASVAHDRGDTHLAHDLEHAGGQRMHEVLDGRLGIDLEIAVACQLLDRFEGEVRVHACGAVCDKERDMVDFTDIAGFHGKRDLGTRVLAQQVVLYGARQQK